ncbi:hydrogenase accessory protein [Blastochloris viridis]|uniref:Hydrogenase expression/formation protein n=1 Tax=Blastochloris viridis TaxID=1079 RepID=A0A0H5BC41_BLAVI|nr:hydrogenase accessory protein [Blastochloris viridis]ALK10306.1 hydrogenase-1 operon protein HyaE [Blastochloris viridis]BAR99760.1 hydrogenase maturation factor HoxO/HyaE [Blastochloris viridis]CUU42968.1 hydrogenase-1 operon protein HyaE [Blastochloris viridis]
MSALIEALVSRHGLALVDRRSIEAFLAPAAGEPAHALLFFTGDPAVRGETADVAVVLPQLLAAFHGRLRAAVVARDAEDALKRRFHVAVVPSLVVVRGAETVGVLPRIRDWSDYVARIAAWLDPQAPALAPSKGPRTEFSYSGQGGGA